MNDSHNPTNHVKRNRTHVKHIYGIKDGALRNLKIEKERKMNIIQNNCIFVFPYDEKSYALIVPT